ncbi:hypothetical protein HPB47_022805 [Ixodes persulcatus]|uniref:Uncharacterized protein n=1 Tax=Ixodes persulcatus TaxID=34615 RepID=A0AC60Q8S1_IXOPE|nr:hypothetical protein HPB47_022805 [Ixodes persulcatus]
MATVSRVPQAYYREGRIADLPRGGRERATSTEEDKLIVAACVVDPFLSAREIRDELELENVSVSTIRRRLHEAGIHSRIVAQKTLLDDRHRKQRMEFASVVESWCPQKWRSVVLTDEASFCTRWDQQQRVWRPYACHHDGLSPLHRICGRMTPESYSDIVEQVLLPYFLNGPFTDGMFLLQQDGAPIHTARSVTHLLDSLGIMRLDWPARFDVTRHLRLADLANALAYRRRLVSAVASSPSCRSLSRFRDLTNDGGLERLTESQQSQSKAAVEEARRFDGGEFPPGSFDGGKFSPTAGSGAPHDLPGS